MSKYSLPCLKFALTINPWRHIQTAWKRKFRCLAEDIMEEDMVDNVEALQAGHTRSTENRVYGLSMQAMAGAAEDILPSYLNASTSWQKHCKVFPGGTLLPYTQLRSSELSNKGDTTQPPVHNSSMSYAALPVEEITQQVLKGLTPMLSSLIQAAVARALKDSGLPSKSNQKEKGKQKADASPSMTRHRHRHRHRVLSEDDMGEFQCYSDDELSDNNWEPSLASEQEREMIDTRDSGPSHTTHTPSPVPTSSEDEEPTSDIGITHRRVVTEQHTSQRPGSIHQGKEHHQGLGKGFNAGTTHGHVVNMPKLTIEDRALQVMSQILANDSVTWRSTQQREAMMAVLQGTTDVIAVLPTGAGKSMLAIVPSIMEENMATILVLPLNSLIMDYEHRLQQMNVPYQLYQGGQDEELNTVHNLILTSADKAQTSNWRHAVMKLSLKKTIARIVFDEAHIPMTARNYRQRLDNIYQVRITESQLVLLSATIPPSFIPELKATFNLLIIYFPESAPDSG
ncbi:hypothetical protein M404DRAFT_31357, partial [Pisolithus tinctorius Marx 270]